MYEVLQMYFKKYNVMFLDKNIVFCQLCKTVIRIPSHCCENVRLKMLRTFVFIKIVSNIR